MIPSPGEVMSQAVRVGETLVRGARSVIGPPAHTPGAAGRPASGWLAVTVFREPAELKSAALPAPLAELGDLIEVPIRPAPGGKGSELAARMRDGQPRGTAAERLSG
ncbi:hypothetical protein LWP59_18310 [Amycolatopsis acidiphila]|uniref:Uncharacterized protein n=1 Tax=Amycolatopsis acidiphila TaxID=715473 RepID=A0A557ZU05_9PSEU|nr:hypothetical protein [Amycolatopsis acidiphila]TVT15499.1 hypothetical protein FNH06_36180 [Amycolatopsis acidiphila]UIJ63445.1 hypothetical protein LWP59_18310 [Amycolatopsis acidiphila]GHG99063.1 hypothetical protein GCM10017788_79430 [Amycolatopsis acidiphila]